MRFPVNIAKFLRTPILNNICERLFLDLGSDSPIGKIRSTMCDYTCLKLIVKIS